METVRLSIEAGVARLTLCRPERGNAFDSAFAADFLAAARICARSSDIRAILLDAEGKAFSHGGDLKALTADRAALPQFVEATLGALNAAILEFAGLGLPMVASVQGAAAGGAIGLVAAADVVLASPAARFVPAFARIGISPDSGSSFFLPRRIGPGRAMEFFLSGDGWTADDAQRHGLVSRVVAGEMLAEEAWRTAAALAAGPTLAYRETKRLLARGALAEQLSAEKEALERCMATDDCWNAMNALLARQPTRFAGR